MVSILTQTRSTRCGRTRLSLSTIYRTLGLLRNLGLVDEVHLGEDHHHYELKSAAAHHHLVCRSCGRVTEFSTLLADELAASVGDEYGYDVQEVRIDLAGLCSPCREEQESGGTTPRGAPRGMSVVAGESAPQGHAAGTRCYSVHCSPGKPGWSPAWRGSGNRGSWRASVCRGLAQVLRQATDLDRAANDKVALGAGEASQVLVIGPGAAWMRRWGTDGGGARRPAECRQSASSALTGLSARGQLAGKTKLCDTACTDLGPDSGPIIRVVDLPGLTADLHPKGRIRTTTSWNPP